MFVDCITVYMVYCTAHLWLVCIINEVIRDQGRSIRELLLYWSARLPLNHHHHHLHHHLKEHHIHHHPPLYRYDYHPRLLMSLLDFVSFNFCSLESLLNLKTLFVCFLLVCLFLLWDSLLTLKTCHHPPSMLFISAALPPSIQTSHPFSSLFVSLSARFTSPIETSHPF